MPIKATRALLNAALDGSLNQAEFRTDPNFGFKVPVAVPGVDPAILDPRRTWADKQAYDATAARLADLFVENRSEEHTSELQSLMRISYAVFCLKKKKTKTHISISNLISPISKYLIHIHVNNSLS